MKPMGKILEEISIESSVGFDETIAKLREQQGPCSDENSFGVRVWFSCSKKGVIVFTGSSGKYSYSIYSVEGRVIEQDGKTIVKIYCLKNRFEKFSYWLSVVLLIALVIWVTVQAIKNQTLFQMETGGLLLLWIFSIVSSIHNTRRSEKNKDFNLEVYKNEIIERVEAIKRWDE